jgi:hypothetical protein
MVDFLLAPLAIGIAAQWLVGRIASPGLRRWGLARAGGHAPIIEYPFTIGQDTNRFYFTQLLHRRPVRAGYYASGAGRFDLYWATTPPSSTTNASPSSG